MRFLSGSRKFVDSCLELAALHVREGDELLKAQADRLTEIEAEGRDVSAARELLNQTCDLLRRQQMDWVRMTHKFKDG
jgi:hypothetical protein